MRLQGATSRPYARAAGLASNRHGVVAFVELLGLGCSQSWIQRQVRSGTLHRLYRGVYSVVPPKLLTIKGRWLGAVLACGPGAVLSHLDAAALWELCRIGSGPIHVTVPNENGRKRRSGIVLHRTSTLPPGHTVVEDSIPVTKPRRTLADLRRTLPEYRFEPILRRAEKLQLDIGRQPGSAEDPDRTELERRFLALCRRHSLPEPDCQVIIGPYTVDFLWPERNLIVEVDGWEAHGTRSAFEDDRARDARLTSRGYRVVRFTWRQVMYEGPTVARIVRTILGSVAA
jgi:very-short-patch-repair endonuclease